MAGSSTRRGLILALVAGALVGMLFGTVYATYTITSSGVGQTGTLRVERADEPAGESSPPLALHAIGTQERAPTLGLALNAAIVRGDVELHITPRQLDLIRTYLDEMAAQAGTAFTGSVLWRGETFHVRLNA